MWNDVRCDTCHNYTCSEGLWVTYLFSVIIGNVHHYHHRYHHDHHNHHHYTMIIGSYSKAICELPEADFQIEVNFKVFVHMCKLFSILIHSFYASSSSSSAAAAAAAAAALLLLDVIQKAISKFFSLTFFSHILVPTKLRRHERFSS